MEFSSEEDESVFEDVSDSEFEFDIDQTKISPMRGRSVKEYDEQLTALRKENFNLKLRIYFLEERMGSTYRLEDKDNIVRKNIEYQVELESLRKELEDKQELLCQAVKAMELEETEHKKLMSKKDMEIAELNERLEAIQKDTTALTEMNDMLLQKQNKLLEDSSVMYTEAFNLQDINSKTRVEIDQLQQQISDLDTQLAEEREHSAILESNLQEADCLHKKCQDLELDLKERDCKIQKLSTDLELKNHSVSSLNLKVRTLEDELKSRTDDVEIKEQELYRQEAIIKEQLLDLEEYKKKLTNGIVVNDKEQRQIETLKSSVVSRDNTITDLENKLERCKGVIRNLESRLEKISLENKRHEDEINTMKSRRTKSVNDNSRFSAWSPVKMDRGSLNSDYSPCKDGDSDDYRLLKEALKKKEEQYICACNMIKSFMVTGKSLEKENSELLSCNQKKEMKIAELQKELKRIANFSPSYENIKISGPNNNQQPDYENSGEDTDQGMNANETDKYKAMTLEWEKQVQDLHQTLKKKEEQIHTYEKQFEATASTMKNKDNRIIELEKEVEQLQELLTEAAGKLEEIQNAKKEETGRPSSTWTRVTEEKDKKIEKLESEVRKHTYNLQGIVNTELWEKNREIEKLQNRLTDKIKIKDEDISKLEKELMGKDMQLKILKDKIEELGIHVNLPSSLISLKQEDKLEIPEELNVLKEKLKLSTEKSKYLQKIVEELSLQLRNTPERESNGKLEQIKTEFTQLQLDFDKSEKSRMEVTNVCVLLTTRLEELAHFLDSLLKHKSVLGLLGIKQHSAIKNAIDQSLDLSKTFNISMMGEDKSLTQLSSLSAFLNASQISNMSLFESYLEDEPNKRASIPVNSVSLTYNSHLSRQNGELQNAKEIINVLREQIQTMKKEIEIRDMELANQNIVSDIQEKSLKNDNELVEVLMDLQSKSPLNKKAIEVMSPNKIYQNLIDNNKTSSPNQKHVVDNQSESETWSEPDRDVSQARIGLDAESLKSSTNTSLARSRSNKHSSGDWVSTESTEDDVSSSKSNSPTKRNAGGDSRRVNVLQENISVLENKLKEKDNELLMLQCKVMDSDNKVKESQIKMHADLEKLRKEKTETENLLLDREKIIETCDKKREELEIKLTEVSKEKSSIIENIKQKEAEIEELKEKMINLQKIIENNNINVQSKLKENDEKWQIMLTNMEKEAELRISEIKDATAQLKEKYEKEWIQKEELNKYHTKMEMVYSELESLKEVLKSAENKGRKLEQDSLDSNKKIQEMERENREKIIALKRELNEYALRTSQAVLERTKVSNEKLKLEQELRRVETREKEKSSEYTEKEKQYINIKNNIQKQLSQLELQKSHLQLKVTELETTNVELHNRILRLQSGDTSNWPKSTPTSPIKISDNFPNIQHMGKHSLGTRFTYNRQRSDMSGYVSEDILTDDNEGGVFNRSAPEGYHWFSHVNHNVAADVADARNIANSSPDLGIESDPGRFSSLETNVSRPLLQTLELTASMNNLLSDNHNEPSGQYCNVPMHKNLQKHNDDLQKTISRLATGLEKTKAQLSLMNKTKKQVEKAVCKEIHKTSIVLRKARANLDSGSENEVLRK